jgi:outer membrane protein
MKAKTYIAIGCFLTLNLSIARVQGQTGDSIWTLQKCIQYSLDKNIDVRKSGLTVTKNMVSAEESKASRFPSVSASISQNQSWSKTQQFSNQFGDYTSSSSTNYGVNSSVVLYNGNKISNTIKQSDLAYKASQYDAETMKESISLSVLNAFLQVLYSDELVKNSAKQVESTTQQLNLAQERLTLGGIAKTDYLQVKSQLATEKLTLANAEKQLAVNKLTLMQLMELPVSDNFNVEHPNLSDSINRNIHPVAQEVFNKALGIKPQIKSSELNLQYTQLSVDIAKAGYLPQVSLNGGVSTGYSSYTTAGYGSQLSNRLSPSLGLSLSIPIYQNKQVRSRVSMAKIDTQTADLSNTNTKNQLRKSVEQACVDVSASEIEFDASREQYNAARESYQVAEEKYTQGLLNSVDFLIQKTNLITAESKFLQSKFTLIFTYKTLDFYNGVPLAL